MDEKLKKYFSSGINPFVDESIDFDEALRRKAVMEGVEDPAANDETYLETQEMADERVRKGLQQSTVNPTLENSSEEMTMAQEAVEDKAQAKYPTEEAIQARLNEVNPQPVEMPEEAISTENDVAAEQAQVARDSLDKPVDPSQTNMLNTTLTAEDSGLKQEELRKNDPVAYVREKYGIAPGAQREEMMKDTDYESLKNMQKRTGILGALSEFDTAIGGLGDWNLLEAKKAGYSGNYKGGALGRMAAGERANFDEKSKFRDTDLDRQTKGLTQEKSGQELKEKMRAFDTMIEDEKEQSKLEGPIYDLTKQFYEKTLGKDFPVGVSPKKLFNVFPQFKDLLKEKIGNDFTAEQNRLNRENQLKLKQMDIDATKVTDKPDPFKSTLVQEQAKDYQTMQSNAPKVEQQLTNINDAIEEFTKYTQSSNFGGTGPFATLGGAKRLVSGQLQNLDNKFKKISMDTLVNSFSGMSKAVDSNTERAAFQATQPDITNDDNVNAEVLLGAKSMALKTKAETEAQRRHVQAGNKDLTNYESPIIGKVSTVVDKNGKMHLIPIGQIEEAKKNGYFDLDTYAKQFILKKGK